MDSPDQWKDIGDHGPRGTAAKEGKLIQARNFKRVTWEDRGLGITQSTAEVTLELDVCMNDRVEEDANMTLRMRKSGK